MGPRAHGRLLVLPLARLPRRERRRVHRQLRDARDVLLHRALHAEHQGLQPAVRFLPSTLVIIVVGPIAGRWTDRIGPRPLMTTGLTLVAGSLLWQSFLDVDT